MGRVCATEIERSVILPNHDEILHILSTQMHLAQADAKLPHAILQYINRVTLYKAPRAVDITETFPLGRGVGWPHDFVPTIKARTEQLQREYDELRTGRRTAEERLVAWRRLRADRPAAKADEAK